jgi:hypothetical protein
VKTLVLAVALMTAAPALADDYPPGLFEKSPEIGASTPELTCDMQHQCYHMDPTHPDKVTPPPAPQYPGITPKPFAGPSTRPPPSPEPEALAPPSEDPDDMRSCFNLRRGLFATPEAAAHARARCD